MSTTAASVELRRARPEDATFMRDLAREAYQHYVARVGAEPGPMRDDYDRVVRQDECWIASTAEPAQDVGYLVLKLGPDHLMIDNVAVRPDQQGRGVGSRLLSFAEERARARACQEIRLYTHVTMVENIALYTRWGYVETHRQEDFGFLRVFMSKALVEPT